MKFRTTLWLLIAACLVALFWYYEPLLSPAPQADGGRRVLAFDAELLKRVEIRYGDLQVVCRRGPRGWAVVRPVAARADDGAMAKLLASLEGLRREEVITAAQRKRRDLSLADYGLAEPRAVFVLDDGLRRMELHVGDEAPLGDRIYVRRTDAGDVVAVQRRLTAMLPGSLEALRDHSVVDGQTARTRRLEIQRPGTGFIQLSRQGDTWVMQQPVAARADRARVNELLDALFSLRVRKFVWDPRVEDGAEGVVDANGIETVSRVESYGLASDVAAARISVWVGDDEVGRELLLGKAVTDEADAVYAKRRESGSIYAVDKGILDIFSVSASELRDAGLFSLRASAVAYIGLTQGERKLVLQKQPVTGWMMTEPFRWKADEQTAARLVEGVLGWRVAHFHLVPPAPLERLGLAPPRRSVLLAADAPDAAAAPPGPLSPGPYGRLLLGELSEGGKTRYAAWEQREGVFELDDGALAVLGEDAAQPLAYRDRTMLAVPRDKVMRISLSRPGPPQTVARSADGAWTAAEPPSGSADEDAIEEVLLHVSNLRAVWIEAHNPADLQGFGLASPHTSLTLGLSGEEGIQKTLRFGSRAGGAYRYAMVQGQDVVFTLAETLYGRLTNDLVRASAPEPQPAP
jgi:hypothetical protein